MEKIEMLTEAKRWLEKDKKMKVFASGGSGAIGMVFIQWGLDIDVELVKTLLGVLGAIVGAALLAIGGSDAVGKGKVQQEAEEMRRNAQMNREESME